MKRNRLPLPVLEMSFILVTCHVALLLNDMLVKRQCSEEVTGNIAHIAEMTFPFFERKTEVNFM